jgi:2,3-bisphosphoglycerate-dependent phosphoglycerate mutase
VTTTLILTRHGQTVWHAENRYAGVSDVDLTDEGRAQAGRLANWAARAGLDAIVSSPVRRARETAQPCGRATGLPVDVVDDLREVDFGIAEGRTIAELDPEVVARFRADPVGQHFPGGEPPAEAADRAVRALRKVAAERPGARVLVVAHNTLLRLALCRLLGLDIRHYRTVFPRLSNAALTTVALAADARLPGLLSLNAPLPSPP